MKPNSGRSPSYQAGFTLVEIMVGLAIGMLATIVIMQVFSVFEAQKRTTTGTADAQTNGGIALYNIGRELQMAGYPLMPVTDSPLECTTLTINGTADATIPNRISPVTIADGGAAAGASDTITLRYGNSQMGGVPTTICATAGTAMTVGNNTSSCPSNNFGCQVGDIALITTGANCAMTSVTALSAASDTPATITLQNATGAAVGANLACLGTWNEITYAVNNGNLERTVAPNVAVPSVVGIVNLQAQYGVSAAANSNQVTQWVDATTATGWNAPTVANRNRIKAVRIAVVARNAKIEPAAVTAACSSTTTAAPTGLCAWAGSVASPAPVVDLSNDPNWARYRYRVFETIIPLRNMIWSKDTL
ncbi:MAG: PilW family protein [Gallionella sp.]|nr:PilW family protein [Gallionella sp.]